MPSGKRTRPCAAARSRLSLRLTRLTSFNRQNCEARSRVRDVVVLIGAQRSREPAARGTLVGLKPGNAALDGRVVRGEIRLTKHVHHESRPETVTGAVLVI